MSETHSLPDFDQEIVLNDEALTRHVLSMGDAGRLTAQGRFPSDARTIEQLLDAFASASRGWPRRRLLLYAHGGGIDEARAVAWSSIRLGHFLKDQIYPIALIWHSDKISQLRDAVAKLLDDGQDPAQRTRGITHVGGIDNRVREGLMRITSTRIWQEIQEDAREASATPEGAMRQLLTRFKSRFDGDNTVELHIIGYSAGAIFQAHVIGLARELALPIASCLLWGPGCSIELFSRTYRPAIETSAIRRFALFNLLDEHEVLDSTNLGYKGSILFAVSNALERDAATPLLGLERCIADDARTRDFLKSHPNVTWVQTPAPGVSLARMHKDFDDDPVTIASTKRFICGARVDVAG
jgi:hypothetical protein